MLQTNQCRGCDLRSIPLPQASLVNADLQGADLISFPVASE
ncbi:pentapeptide repeat-containing protein [Microcoleus sp. herbarium8]